MEKKNKGETKEKTEKSKRQWKKGQAGIEALAGFAILIIFLILAYLIYLNDQSIASRQTSFLQAQRVTHETAILINSGNRVDGFYAEFQVPLILPGFGLNLTNYSVIGVLDTSTGKSEIQIALNATVYCSTCFLNQGTYWASTSNKVTTIGRKS